MAPSPEVCVAAEQDQLLDVRANMEALDLEVARASKPH
jgi:hypothetical protein